LCAIRADTINTLQVGYLRLDESLLVHHQISLPGRGRRVWTGRRIAAPEAVIIRGQGTGWRHVQLWQKRCQF